MIELSELRDLADMAKELTDIRELRGKLTSGRGGIPRITLEVALTEGSPAYNIGGQVRLPKDAALEILDRRAVALAEYLRSRGVST